MRSSKTIHVVFCHAEGVVGDGIVGGVFCHVNFLGAARPSSDPDGLDHRRYCI